MQWGWSRALMAIFMWCAGTAAAQTTILQPDSSGMVQLHARRLGLSTFTGYNRFFGRQQFGKEEVRVRFTYDWLYNNAQAESPLVRNDYATEIAHRHELSPHFTFRQQASLYTYQANRTSIFNYLPELQYQLQPDSLQLFRSRVFAGIRRDQRFLRHDWGPMAGAQLTYQQQTADASAARSLHLLALRSNLGPRVYQQFKAEGSARQIFNEFAQGELRVGYFANRSGDYLGTNVQDIRSDTLFADARLRYIISKSFTFRTSNSIALPHRTFLYRPPEGSQPVRHNSSYRQQQLETEQAILFRKGPWDAQGSFLYSERTRLYSTETDRIKDIRERTTGWKYELNYLLSRKHTLSAQTTAQLLRLDTPSELNSQDRDEVYYLARTSWNAQWHPAFRTTLALSGDDRQFVFIKAEQSAENYRDRTLRYEPGFTWQTRDFSWTAAVQLWSTYHVRAIPKEQLKNRANRTYLQVHQWRWDMSKAFTWQLDFTRRENQTGLLNWEKFTESPLDTTTSNDIRLKLQYRKIKENSTLALSTGYRYFRQRVSRQSGLNQNGALTTLIYLRETALQHGPELGITYLITNRMNLDATGWLQFNHTFRSYKPGNRPFVGESLTAEQLALRQGGVYPYFTVTFEWRLRKPGP